MNQTNAHVCMSVSTKLVVSGIPQQVKLGVYLGPSSKLLSKYSYHTVYSTIDQDLKMWQ